MCALVEEQLLALPINFARFLQLDLLLASDHGKWGSPNLDSQKHHLRVTCTKCYIDPNDRIYTRSAKRAKMTIIIVSVLAYP